MGTIQEDILEQFFAKLTELDEFSEERVMVLRGLFVAEKKLKAAKLVAALSDDSKEEAP